jgi:periplasmic divalent cation tolerance protein
MDSPPLPVDAVIVLCTAPKEGGHDLRLARELVNRRLAACVNIVPGVLSVYRYGGAIHEDAEVQLVIKTTAQRLDAMRAWLEDAHPYEVPEILALSVRGGSERYLQWMGEQTSPLAPT